jgi:hypothetical protein
MKLLIIPGVPLFAIFGSQFLGTVFPLWYAIPIILIILAAACAYLLIWLLQGHKPRLINGTPPTYLYGVDFGKGTSKTIEPAEYCRHPDGTIEITGTHTGTATPELASPSRSKGGTRSSVSSAKSS